MAHAIADFQIGLHLERDESVLSVVVAHGGFPHAARGGLALDALRAAAADAEQRHGLGLVAHAASVGRRRDARQQVALGRDRLVDAADVGHDAALRAQHYDPRLVDWLVVRRPCRSSGGTQCKQYNCGKTMKNIFMHFADGQPVYPQLQATRATACGQLRQGRSKTAASLQ